MRFLSDKPLRSTQRRFTCASAETGTLGLGVAKPHTGGQIVRPDEGLLVRAK